MKLMERRYRCANGVVERTRFFVGDNTVIFRGRKRVGKERKQEQNLQSCIRKVARILNCNYNHDNGLLLTLDLHEGGLEKLLGKLGEEQRAVLSSLRNPVGEIGTWQAVGKRKLKRRDTGTEAKEEQGKATEEAMNALREAMDHELTLWLRRIKRKHEGKIKALMVVSDMDHETGELVRCHCHAVLAAEGISWDLLRQEWKLGSVDIRQLRKQPDYTPIAVYLMKQVRRQPEKKKYRVTQGMEMPVVEERIITGHSEIRVPPGAYVLERSEFHTDSVGQYIRYIPGKKGRRKQDRKEDDRDEVQEDTGH